MPIEFAMIIVLEYHFFNFHLTLGFPMVYVFREWLMVERLITGHASIFHA